MLCIELLRHSEASLFHSLPVVRIQKRRTKSNLYCYFHGPGSTDPQSVPVRPQKCVQHSDTAQIRRCSGNACCQTRTLDERVIFAHGMTALDSLASSVVTMLSHSRGLAISAPPPPCIIVVHAFTSTATDALTHGRPGAHAR